MIKFIDLFCGLGGFRVALESWGCECVFSSDIDKYARETYKLNFGEYPAGDITVIDEKDIPDHDILCAGFPCQPFIMGWYQFWRHERTLFCMHVLKRKIQHFRKMLLDYNHDGKTMILYRLFKEIIIPN